MKRLICGLGVSALVVLSGPTFASNQVSNESVLPSQHLFQLVADTDNGEQEMTAADDQVEAATTNGEDQSATDDSSDDSSQDASDSSANGEAADSAASTDDASEE